MEYVERTLKANPGIANADLFAGAREIDPAVAQLSARQFHAQYPLPGEGAARNSRRARAQEAAGTGVPTGEEATTSDALPVKEGDPAAVRRLLLDLTKELASAESKAEVIEVMARLDDYVAEIVATGTGSSGRGAREVGPSQTAPPSAPPTALRTCSSIGVWLIASLAGGTYYRIRLEHYVRNPS